ncbi:hypothetical protein HK101_003010 [Irineochytrium annulatum]|nr:hypothetical protein HK101_003010 [Irineochytrium annulatum]
MADPDTPVSWGEDDGRDDEVDVPPVTAVRASSEWDGGDDDYGDSGHSVVVQEMASKPNGNHHDPIPPAGRDDSRRKDVLSIDQLMASSEPDSPFIEPEARAMEGNARGIEWGDDRGRVTDVEVVKAAGVPEDIDPSPESPPDDMRGTSPVKEAGEVSPRKVKPDELPRRSASPARHESSSRKRPLSRERREEDGREELHRRDDISRPARMSSTSSSNPAKRQKVPASNLPDDVRPPGVERLPPRSVDSSRPPGVEKLPSRPRASSRPPGVEKLPSRPPADQLPPRRRELDRPPGMELLPSRPVERPLRNGGVALEERKTTKSGTVVDSYRPGGVERKEEKVVKGPPSSIDSYRPGDLLKPRGRSRDRSREVKGGIDGGRALNVDSYRPGDEDRRRRSRVVSTLPPPMIAAIPCAGAMMTGPGTATATGIVIGTGRGTATGITATGIAIRGTRAETGREIGIGSAIGSAIGNGKETGVTVGTEIGLGT